MLPSKSSLHKPFKKICTGFNPLFWLVFVLKKTKGVKGTGKETL